MFRCEGGRIYRAQALGPTARCKSSCAAGASAFISLSLTFPICKVELLLESSLLGGCKDNRGETFKVLGVRAPEGDYLQFLTQRAWGGGGNDM